MPKVVFSSSESIAATTTEPNVLDGSKVSNVPTDDNYRVTFAATGETAGELFHEFTADTDVAVQRSQVNAENRVPRPVEDFVDEFDVSGGSKLFLEVENEGAGSNDYFFSITLTPHSML